MPLSDPANWQAFVSGEGDVTPPPHYELLAQDGRYYWSHTAEVTTPIEWIGGELPGSVRLRAVVLEQSAQEGESTFSLDVSFQDFGGFNSVATMPNEVGASVDVDVAIPSETDDLRIVFVGNFGPGMYGGVIALTIGDDPEPEPTDCCDECTTALDMIKGSMRLSGIIDATETPSDEDAQAALKSLNQLMGQWERDGIRLGWLKVCELDECLPIQEQDERAVRFNFAIELGVEYGVEPLPNVQRIAEETYAALCKQYQQVGELSVEHLPSSRLGGSIETG